MWLPGEPAGGTSKNCAFMLVTWRGWTTWSCGVPMPLRCPQVGYLTMRGLCKDSKLERVYIPQNYHVNGQLMYYGILKSRIEYVDEGWRLRTGDNTTAVSKARKVSFLLGKSEWLLTGESSECSGGSDSFSLQLKLTGCRLEPSTSGMQPLISGYQSHFLFSFQGGRVHLQRWPMHPNGRAV